MGLFFANAQVTLSGPLHSRGLLTVETKLGWMVNDSMPVLLTGDAELAREVERILSSTPAAAAGEMRGDNGLTCCPVKICVCVCLGMCVCVCVYPVHACHSNYLSNNLSGPGG